MSKSAQGNGYPTKRTPEIEAEIIRRLASGEPLAQICRTEGFPHPSTVRDWRDDDEEFALAIARAREDGFDAIADETLAIADDARNDWMERLGEGAGEAWAANGEHIQRSKLRIETRLKLLAKWDPKRYGEMVKTEHSGPNGGEIPFAVIERRVVDPKAAK